MPTINSREIVDKIIAGNGRYHPEDDLVVKIVQYNNQFNGGVAYGLVYEHQDLMAYEHSPHCHNPQVLWELQP